jgi:abhydrolase domain-containing protein 11
MLLSVKVFVLDARNHGDSPHTQEMSYESMSKDVVKFLSDRNYPICSLIGHSMGGKTAMFTALHSPDCVERLVVVDVSPTRAPGTGDTMTAVSALCGIDLETVTSKRDLEDALSGQIPDKYVRQFLLTNLERSQETKQYTWRVNLPTIAKSLPVLKTFPHVKKTFTGPSLFLGGSNSNYITSADEPEIRRIFPNCTLQFVSGAGHWVHTDRPSEFVQAVTEFFTS